jgi:hypothetical protein
LICFEQKKDCSFLKKRTKKLLTLGARLAGSVGKGIKVFCFFFSKGRPFLSVRGPTPGDIKSA